MIRRAKLEDIPEIAETYTELLAYEKEHGSHSNWKLGYIQRCRRRKRRCRREPCMCWRMGQSAPA